MQQNSKTSVDTSAVILEASYEVSSGIEEDGIINRSFNAEFLENPPHASHRLNEMIGATLSEEDEEEVNEDNENECEEENAKKLPSGIMERFILFIHNQLKYETSNHGDKNKSKDRWLLTCLKGKEFWMSP